MAAARSKRKKAQLEPTVSLSASEWEDEEPEIAKIAEKAAHAAYDAGCTKFPALRELPRVEIGLVFSDDHCLENLNRDYRGKPRPTNVLSFPYLLAEDGVQSTDTVLGDVFLSFETVKREADEKNITLAAHAAHMVVHGVLHLLGHDHLEEDEAIEMEKLEGDILQELGYDNPYKM
jgi:probable rRNA maturation factor